MTKVGDVAPVFTVSDVGATVRWYRDRLGFDFDPFPDEEPWVWAIMSRDGVQIMLQRVEGYEKPDLRPLRPVGMWDAYLWVDDVEALWADVKDRVEINRGLTEKPYGCTEFEVLDPNGYVLAFGACA